MIRGPMIVACVVVSSVAILGGVCYFVLGNSVGPSASAYVADPTTEHFDALRAAANTSLTRAHTWAGLTQSQKRAVVVAAYRADDGRALRWLYGRGWLGDDFFDAYLAAPYRGHNANMNGIVGLMIVARTRAYRLAYAYLAQAAMRDKAYAASVRALVRHFGCMRADSIWAGVTRSTGSLSLEGERYPVSTRAREKPHAWLVEKRLKLDRGESAPVLGTACPINQFEATIEGGQIKLRRSVSSPVDATVSAR